MQRLADALAALAERWARRFASAAIVETIWSTAAERPGSTRAAGERFGGRCRGLQRRRARSARAVRATAARRAGDAAAGRSLSAVTWATVGATPRLSAGPPQCVFRRATIARSSTRSSATARLPAQPTIYVCAQDRDDDGAAPDTEPERLFVSSTRRPSGDAGALDQRRLSHARKRRFGAERRCGLTLEPTAAHGDDDAGGFAARCSRRRGARLYGPASHGWRGVVPPPGRAQRDAGAVSGGRQRASGCRACRWRRCRAGWRRCAAIGGPRFDHAGPPGGYAWWYVDA